MAYFAVVNTFCNAAGELVSERLFPLPRVWDDSDVPPMPTDPPPHGFVPLDSGTPKYMAYVPKLADPRLPYIRAEDGGWEEGYDCCDMCRNIEKKVHKVEVKWLKMSREKTF